VAPIVSDSFSTEDARDRVGEAEMVMQLAGIAPGMSVADIGAGEGYYTVRLSPIVGPRGRVLAEDIVSKTRDRLAQRVQRENLDNVAVRLGQPADLREGLKDGGLVIVVDADRPVKRHGMPPAQLMCEFDAIGLKPVRTSRLTGSDAYFAAFKVAGPRPDPSAIRPCEPKD
jgi:hypothetical protein